MSPTSSTSPRRFPAGAAFEGFPRRRRRRTRLRLGTRRGVVGGRVARSASKTKYVFGEESASKTRRGGAGRPHRGEVPRTGTLGAKFQARRTTLPRTLRLFGRRTRRSTREGRHARASIRRRRRASPPRTRIARASLVGSETRRIPPRVTTRRRESPARRLPRDARPMSAAREPIRDVPTRFPRTRSASRKQTRPRKTRRDQPRNFGERIRSGHRARRRRRARLRPRRRRVCFRTDPIPRPRLRR